MLKDKPQTNYIQASSLTKEVLYNKLFEFVEHNIGDFLQHYSCLEVKVKGENNITAQLQFFFSDRVSETALPFKFQNQYPYPESDRTSDVGIIIPMFSKQKAFCVIEAKRLLDNNHSKEYVHGTRGGIERFKRNYHAHNLPHAIMIGYIQMHDTGYWHKKINFHIEQLSTSNTDTTISWFSSEKLSSPVMQIAFSKSQSVSKRIDDSNISIRHLWLHLV